MWRKRGNHEQVVTVEPGLCLTIPLYTHLQFPSFGDEPLAVIGVKMPPWPGGGEAYPVLGSRAMTVNAE
jgi:mannose-6-phosphate isomerase-like protein (cupin superfamily)